MGTQEPKEISVHLFKDLTLEMIEEVMRSQ